MAGVVGFEPTASRSKDVRSTSELHPYKIQNREIKSRVKGFEPLTPRSRVWRSTIELHSYKIFNTCSIHSFTLSSSSTDSNDINCFGGNKSLKIH